MEPKARSSSVVLAVLSTLSLVWVVLLLAAPYGLPAGSVPDLSGAVGTSDNSAPIQAMPEPWRAVYGAGDRLCHQRADRSFLLNGNVMPFCSRCLGVFAGLFVGLVAMLAFTIPFRERFFLSFVVIGLAPIALDGLGQLAGLWESTNPLRLATGLLAGVVCGVAAGYVVEQVQVLRSQKRPR